MNNIPSVIGRVLIDNGYDVTLFFLNEYDHFHPESDSWNKIINLKYVKLNWEKDDIIKLNSNKINEILGGYDFYIGVEWAPAILYKAGIRLDLFYVMGTDLSNYPFYKSKKIFAPVWQLKYILLAKQQYYGIKYASFISMNKSSDFLENCLDIVKPSGKRILGIPYLYLNQYDDAYLSKSDYKKQFDLIRTQFDFLIFHHIRHEWVTSKGTIHDKGNDILFKSVQKLINNYPEKKIGIITIEYGTDIENSKTLCKDLCIEKNVIWMPKMEKKHLLYGLKISDVFVGQLIDKFSGYTSLFEALAMKKAVIHNGIELDKSLYPMLIANNEISLLSQLEKCINKEIDLIEMGLKSYDWIKYNGFELPVSQVLNAIETKSKKRYFLFGNIYCFAFELYIKMYSPFEILTLKLRAFIKKYL
jgi:hypothetical protein